MPRLPLLRDRSRRAFTLIELIVTIVLLGILAALAVPAFSAVVDRSQVEAAEASWEGVLREAQALAAFDETSVTADHIASALGDTASAAGEVADVDGAPYLYVDTDTDSDGVADGTVTAGQWSVDVPAAPSVLVAADDALAADGKLLVAAVGAPGVASVVEVRDYDTDASGAADAADTEAHYNDAPTAGGSEDTAAPPAAQELLDLSTMMDCSTNYYTGLSDSQHPGQSVTLGTGAVIQTVEFFNNRYDDGTSATSGDVPLRVQVYDGNVTDLSAATLLGEATATVTAARGAWVSIDLTDAVELTSDTATVIVSADGWGSYDGGSMGAIDNTLGPCLANDVYTGGNEVVRTSSGSTSVSAGSDEAFRILGQPAP